MVHSNKVLVGLLASLAFVVAEDYVCPAGQSSTSVSVGAGDAMSFFTNEAGDKYTGNVNCKVTYEMADTCKQLLFDCEEFSLGKGDFLAVSRQTKKGVKTKKFKNKKFKVQKSNGDISVLFKSNKKKNGDGAFCYVECSKAAPGVTTTTSGPGSSSTETPTTTTSVICGPSDCNLSCPSADQCLQDSNIQCVTSPCCPQWSCQKPQCPPQRPEFNSECSSSQEGLECNYGKQTCCGEELPELVFNCDSGKWRGYHVDTVCMFNGGVCPTTTTSSSCICPAVFDPVCGSNNQTYSNNCQASCAGVDVGCEGQCPCGSDCVCIEVFQPVCGNDGQTYSNSCKAACAGVSVGCEGECPCSNSRIRFS